MDRSLRDLERIFQQTGNPADEAAYFRALLRSDYITEKQIIAAARLGYPAARLLYPDLLLVPIGSVGVPYYENVEDFLFSLVTLDPEDPSPQLPFLFGLACLEEVQPIFEINPVEDMQLLAHHGAHAYVEVPQDLTLDIFAGMSRQIFEIWTETRWDPEMEIQNQSIFGAIQDAQPIWDLAANADFDRNDASFHNAANAYWHFSRAIESAQGATSFNPRTFTDLRLAIGDVIHALHENSESNGKDVVRWKIRKQVLDRVANKIVPIILDLD